MGELEEGQMDGSGCASEIRRKDFQLILQGCLDLLVRTSMLHQLKEDNHVPDETFAGSQHF